MTCDEVADAKQLIGDLQQARRDRRAAIDDALTGKKAVLNLSQHDSVPFLVVPFDDGDGGKRPLADRPDVPSPLRSAALDVVTPDGESVDRFDYDTTYELRCKLRNDGDMDIPPTRVEFFVRHCHPYAEFDQTDHKIIVAPRPNQVITGTTSLEPGTEMAFEVRSGDSDPMWADDIWEYTATVGDDRSFGVAVDLSMFSIGDEEVYIATTYGSTGLASELTFRSDPVEHRGRMNWDLSVPLDAVLSDQDIIDGWTRVNPPPYEDPVFAGADRVRVPASRTASASVTYTTPPPWDPSTGSPGLIESQHKAYANVLTSVYARVYSLCPLDAPNDWGVLDHRLQRHVGRTERAWVAPPEVDS